MVSSDLLVSLHHLAHKLMWIGVYGHVYNYGRVFWKQPLSSSFLMSGMVLSRGVVEV